MATDYTYIYTAGAATVYAIDPATYAIAATITLPGAGSGDSSTFAMTPDRKNLFVLDSTTGTYYQIDTASNTVIHTTVVGPTVVNAFNGVATNNFAYFPLRTLTGGIHIAIFDVASGAMTTAVFSGMGGMTGNPFSAPQTSAVTPDQSQVWFGEVNGPGPGGTTVRGVFVLDTLSTSPTATFISISTSSSFFAQNVTMTNDGNWVYAYDGNGNPLVYKFATATKTLSATITTGTNSPVIGIDATNTNVYLSESTIPKVSVLSIASNTITSTFTPPHLNYVRPAIPSENLTDSYISQGGTGGASVLVIPNASPGSFTTVAVAGPSNWCATSPSGDKLWVSEGIAPSPYSFQVIDTATNTIISAANVVLTGNNTQWISPGAGVLTPPLKVGDLFIPRKGRSGIAGGYEDQDLIIDWLAIENWANHSWSPAVTNLFLPAKPVGRPMTLSELDQNWRTLEEWADALGTVGGTAIRPLFIPRKGSLEEVDWDRNFWAIQTWANSLNP